jgi:alpha-tubulin suppressor-like RCC1 family protein
VYVCVCVCARDATRDTDGKRSEHAPYLDGLKCVDAASASIHSALLMDDGKLYTFGCASSGRMGVRKFVDGLHGKKSRMKCYISPPTAVEIAKDVFLVKVDSHRRHMVALGRPRSEL